MPKGTPNPLSDTAAQMNAGAAPLAYDTAAVGPGRLDAVIANCARCLLDKAPGDDAVPQALADLVDGLDASHAILFQIKSYHVEDCRGQWLACSSADHCTCCPDIHQWDFLRLFDGDMRASLEAGQCGWLDPCRMLPEFGQVYTERGIRALLVVPLTVMGQWWGCLCIEKKCAPVGDTATGRDLSILAALFSIYYERRRAVEGCQERDTLSGALEMAGTVCHKLNQPMQVILGYASMVTSGDIRDPEQVGEIVQLIEDETRQMGIITKNLMGITKNRSLD